MARPAELEKTLMIDTPVFGSAAAAAPHHLASEAGRAILAEGGNAIEAMVAMAATISVVYPHMNAIGGDGFWLIHEPGKPVVAIDACGPAAALASRDFYAGLSAIPSRDDKNSAALLASSATPTPASVKGLSESC